MHTLFTRYGTFISQRRRESFTSHMTLSLCALSMQRDVYISDTQWWSSLNVDVKLFRTCSENSSSTHHDSYLTYLKTHNNNNKSMVSGNKSDVTKPILSKGLRLLRSEVKLQNEKKIDLAKTLDEVTQKISFSGSRILLLLERTYS